MTELLALVEGTDERIAPNFCGVDPPRILREVQQKLDVIVLKHRREQTTAAKKPGKKRR